MRSTLGPMPEKSEEDQQIFYTWNPLWQMDEVQKSTMTTQKANAFKVDVDTGLMNDVVLKKAREAQLIADGTYPGLQQIIDEFDDDPNLENQEANQSPPVITDPNDPNYDPTKDPASPDYVPPDPNAADPNAPVDPNAPAPANSNIPPQFQKKTADGGHGSGPHEGVPHHHKGHGVSEIKNSGHGQPMMINGKEKKRTDITLMKGETKIATISSHQGSQQTSSRKR